MYLPADHQRRQLVILCLRLPSRHFIAQVEECLHSALLQRLVGPAVCVEQTDCLLILMDTYNNDVIDNCTRSVDFISYMYCRSTAFYSDRRFTFVQETV